MAKRDDRREQTQRAAEQRDAENRRRFTDQSGVEASDLPDKGRGPAESHVEVELARNLPHQHGGELPERAENFNEGGARGAREASDADDQGGRKRN